MLRIVSQVILPDNREAAYQRFVTEPRAALEQAVAATVSADASFAERGRAILIVANEACRLALAATLQATAPGHPADLSQRAAPDDVAVHRGRRFRRCTGRRVIRGRSRPAGRAVLISRTDWASTFRVLSHPSRT